MMVSPSSESDRPEAAVMGAPGVGPSEAPRILVVEDEWFVSMEIQSALQDAGYATAGPAVTASEAISQAASHRPDLILMDIRLQGNQDGVDAAIEINRRFGLRCVFVTAHGDAATRQRAQPANPLGWLSKPFSPSELIAAVKAGLRDLKD